MGAIHNAIGTACKTNEPEETVEILSLLIEQGVKPSASDSTDMRLRPLHRAAIINNVSATRFLLDKDSDMINLTDAEGKTALHHACLQPNQKLELVKVLVENGANFAEEPRPQLPDCDGQAIERFLDEWGLR